MKVYNIDGVVATLFDNGSTYINSSTDPNVATGSLHPLVFSPDPVKDTYIDATVLFALRVKDQARMLKGYLALTSVISFLGVAFVIARIYIRVAMLKRFFIDDFLVLVALLAGLVAFGLYVADFVITMPWNLYYDTHSVWSPGEWDLNIWSQLFSVQPREAIFYGTNNAQATFGRLSILYTFNRLAIQENAPIKKIRKAIAFLAIFMLVELIPVTWIAIDPCWPPTGGFWSRKFEDEHRCLSYRGDTGDTFRVVFIAAAAFNSVSDLFCFALPFLVFSSLRISISASQRLGLMALFGFGFCVFLVSIGRCVGTATYKPTDYYPNNSQRVLLVWAHAEANAVMIGACLPVIARPVWRAVTSRIRRKTNASTEALAPDKDLELRGREDFRLGASPLSGSTHRPETGNEGTQTDPPIG